MDNRLVLSTTAFTVASFGMMAGPPPVLAADAGVKALTYGVGDAVSGYVRAEFGMGTWRKFDSGTEDDNESFTQLSGSGRLNWWLSPTMSFQGDVYGTGFNTKDTTFGAAGHLAWRNPNQGALGVMASIGNRTSGDCCGGTRLTALALQGQLYMGNITLYGQLGGMHEENSSSTLTWMAFQGRFFLNQDTVLKGDVAIADLWGDSLTRFGVEIEHKPMGMPISIFARAATESIDFGSGWKQTSHEVKIGAKLIVNEPTLLFGDRRGATFLDMNPIYGDKASKVW